MKLFALALCALPLVAQPSAIDLLEQKTLARLAAFDREFEGALGVAATDLTTGHTFALNGDTQFTQASVIKIPILVAMARLESEGRLHWTGPIELTPADVVGGSGHLQHRLKQGNVTLPLGELVEAMIVDSDNTATNKCIGLAGMDYINRTAASLGAGRTLLQRKMMDGAAARAGRENISTPNEMARLMEAIYHGRAGNRAACDRMIAIMKKVHGGIAEGLPLDIETASKIGEVPGARGETGIVYLEGRPFVLSVMSSFIDDRRSPVPEVTRIVFRFFEQLAGSNRYGNRLR